ncbi:MAG: UbiA family prenyltransferase [Planctomycetota bacterium]|nr:UbiA family prenyltransferase [Planctomycetota bacterium]
MKLKPFLKLIRLPNVITAACNSLAGALCAGVGLNRWPDLLMLALSSMSIYAAGILWNDLFDLEEDRRERPSRPLPSGEVSVRLAWLISILLAVIGVILAALVSLKVGVLAIILLSVVFSYDRWTKKNALGPWNMGLCRGLNLALGLVLKPVARWGVLAVLGYSIYIAGVTYISRQETKTGETKGLRQGFILLIAGMAMVIAAMLLNSNRTIYGFDIQNDVPLLGGLFILIVLMKRLTTVWKTAFAEPRPETIQNVVKTGIINLPLIDFAIVLAVAGPLATIPIAILFSLARLTARKLYTT